MGYGFLSGSNYSFFGESQAIEQNNTTILCPQYFMKKEF